MPIQPPSLDDRGFNDLVDELLSRIPAHTPEWTHPKLGDPGRTLIELFAWLGDTLLYRMNFLPERQRLVFLRLLGQHMRPATPAEGVVSLRLAADSTTAIYLPSFTTVQGPVDFETRSEITALPVTVESYYKRRPTQEESEQFDLEDLQDAYGLGQQQPEPYITTATFANDMPLPDGLNIADKDVVADRSLWLALLAGKKELVDESREALGTAQSGSAQILNIGIMPLIRVPAMSEQIGKRARIPHQWEISNVVSAEQDRRVEYIPLSVIEDTTDGLTRQGVVRLALPGSDFMEAPSNDVRENPDAGTASNPPRLDVPDTADRLVAWIRLRPMPDQNVSDLSLSWVGINAVQIEQRKTIRRRIIGQSNGTADQSFQLPGSSIDRDTLQLQVEHPGIGYRPWQAIDDLALAGRDDMVFRLDSESGTVQFGDGVRGHIPDARTRIRVELLRAGGGQQGNLFPKSLTQVAGHSKIKVVQSLPTEGGTDAETLAEAQQRIPDLFRHKDRAVTEDDYKRLAATTPGVRLGRVELLPRFKPHQRRPDIPGVVSVMVLPFKSSRTLPNPRPDRPTLETVHAHLDARRPLGTEMYVIGAEYVPLSLSVGVDIRDGFEHDAVVNAVREQLGAFLWPLIPGGPDGTGWPLGRSVVSGELEVTVARVPGVQIVRGVTLFDKQEDDWQLITPTDTHKLAQLLLEDWQLPELFSVVVLVDQDPATDLRPFLGSSQAGEEPSQVAVPVVPEVC